MARKTPAKASMKELADTCARLAEDMGYALVEVARTQEPGGRYLRVYLDLDGGISLNDCERYHRALLPLVEDIDYDFLEVCSPGLDRPLKTDRDFQRHTGDRVEIRFFHPVDGQKKLEGVLMGLVENQVTLAVGEQVRAFPRKEVALVKPLLDQEELARAQEVDFEAAPEGINEDSEGS